MNYDIKRYKIYSEKLTQPVSAALLSDNHWNYDNIIVEKIHKNSTNVVFITGDLIDKNKKELIEKAKDFLEKLCEYSKVYYVLGNHEEFFNLNSSVFKNIKGLTILKNQIVEDSEFIVGGVLEKKCDKKWIDNFNKTQGYKILLCHKPDYLIKNFNENSYNLALCGHTHGGQIRFFNRGLYVPSIGILPKYTGGIYNNKIIVSRGLCNTARYIPRLFNNPEIVFIDFIPEVLSKE